MMYALEAKIGKLRKALFVYEMNKGKPRTKEETKLRLAQDVVDAARELGEFVL